MFMNNNIFIHADDYGYSENISRDILSCIDDGIVNSVSVMVYGNQEYYQKIKNRNLKNISLHLNLTSLNLNEEHKNSKILNNLSFTKLFFANKKLKELCKAEIEKQILIFKDEFGYDDFNADGHHHIQIIPWIFDFLSNKEFIIQLRIPNEKVKFFSIKIFYNITFWRNLLAVNILKILTLWKSNNRYKNFAGLLYSGIYNNKIFLKHLKSLKKSDLPFEITFHPGSGTESEKEIFKHSHFKYVTSKNRRTEFNLLKSINLDDVF